IVQILIATIEGVQTGYVTALQKGERQLSCRHSSASASPSGASHPQEKLETPEVDDQPPRASTRSSTQQATAQLPVPREEASVQSAWPQAQYGPGLVGVQVGRAPPARHQHPDPSLAKRPLPCARATKGSRVRIREGRSPRRHLVPSRLRGRATPNQTFE